jgi:hypothetical protein
MTLIPLTYFGYAVGIATAIIAVSWVVEILAGYRLVFSLSITAIFIVISGCAFFSYRELTGCVLSGAPAFPQCEWSAPFLWLVWGMTIATLPLLIVSAVVLRRWSKRPIKRSA